MKEAGERLFEKEHSWLNAFHTPKNRYDGVHCFRKVRSDIIPNKSVWKCFPGWIALTRKHASDIVELPILVGADLVVAWGKGAFASNGNNVWAPEEVYFPTLLAILGYLREDHDDEIKRTNINFAKFARHGDANPITFNRLDHKLLYEMRETNALFGRKFSEGSCSVQLWEQLIFTDSDKEEQSLLGQKEAENVKVVEETGKMLGSKRKQQELQTDINEIPENHAHDLDNMIESLEDKSNSTANDNKRSK